MAGVSATIRDTQVTGIFMPGGDAWHFLALVGTEHLNQAIAMTPNRTGTLARSHYPVPIMTPYRQGGEQGARYTIRNDADYALYVHDGTTGPIMAHGGYMSVPMVRGSKYPRFQAKFVDGQSAKPWIKWAADVALAPYTG